MPSSPPRDLSDPLRAARLRLPTASRQSGGVHGHNGTRAESYRPPPRRSPYRVTWGEKFTHAGEPGGEAATGAGSSGRSPSGRGLRETGFSGRGLPGLPGWGLPWRGLSRSRLPGTRRSGGLPGLRPSRGREALPVGGRCTGTRRSGGERPPPAQPFAGTCPETRPRTLLVPHRRRGALLTRRNSAEYGGTRGSSARLGGVRHPVRTDSPTFCACCPRPPTAALPGMAKGDARRGRTHHGKGTGPEPPPETTGFVGQGHTRQYGWCPASCRRCEKSCHSWSSW